MPVMSDDQFQAVLRQIEETTAAVNAANAAPEPSAEEVFVSRFFPSRPRPPFDARALLTDMAERQAAAAPPWSSAA